MRVLYWFWIFSILKINFVEAQFVYYYTGGSSVINTNSCPSNICIQCGTGFYNRGCGLDANKISGQNCEACPNLPDYAFWLPWGPYPSGISVNSSICKWQCKSGYHSDGVKCLRTKYSTKVFVDVMKSCPKASAEIQSLLNDVCSLLDPALEAECYAVALDNARCVRNGICPCPTRRRLLDLSTTLEVEIITNSPDPVYIDWSKAPLYLHPTAMVLTTLNSIGFQIAVIPYNMTVNLTEYKSAFMHAFNLTLYQGESFLDKLLLGTYVNVSIVPLPSSNVSSSIVVTLFNVPDSSVNKIVQIVLDSPFENRFASLTKTSPVNITISLISNTSSLYPVTEFEIDDSIVKHSVKLTMQSQHFTFDQNATDELQQLLSSAFHIPVDNINVSVSPGMIRSPVIFVTLKDLPQEIIDKILDQLSTQSLDVFIQRDGNESHLKNYENPGQTGTRLNFTLAKISANNTKQLPEYRLALIHALTATWQMSNTSNWKPFASYVSTSYFLETSQLIHIQASISEIPFEFVNKVLSQIYTEEFRQAFFAFPHWSDSSSVLLNISTTRVMNQTLDNILSDTKPLFSVLDYTIKFELHSKQFYLNTTVGDELKILVGELLNIADSEFSLTLKPNSDNSTIIVTMAEVTDQLIERTEERIALYDLDAIILQNGIIKNWKPDVINQTATVFPPEPNGTTYYNVSFSVLASTANFNQTVIMAVQNIFSILLNLDKSLIFVERVGNSSQLDIVIVSQPTRMMKNVTRVVLSPSFQNDFNNSINQQKLPYMFIKDSVTSLQTGFIPFPIPPSEVLYNISFALLTSTTNLSQTVLDAVQETLSVLLDLDESAIIVSRAGNSSRLDVVIESQTEEVVNFVNQLIVLPLFQKAFNASINAQKLPAMTFNGTVLSTQSTFPESNPIILFNMSFNVYSYSKNLTKAEMEDVRILIANLVNVEKPLVNVQRTQNASIYDVHISSQPIQNIANISRLIATPLFQQQFSNIIDEEQLPPMSINITVDLTQSTSTLPIELLLYDISFNINSTLSNMSQIQLDELELILSKIFNVDVSLIDLDKVVNSSTVVVDFASQPIEVVLNVTRLIQSGEFTQVFNASLKAVGLPTMHINDTITLTEDGIVPNVMLHYNLTFTVISSTSNLSQSIVEALQTIFAEFFNLEKSDIVLFKPDNQSIIDVVVVSQPSEVIDYVSQLIATPLFKQSFNTSIKAHNLPYMFINSTIKSMDREIVHILPDAEPPVTEILYNISFSLLTSTRILSEDDLDALQDTLSTLLHIDKSDIVLVKAENSSILDVVITSQPDAIVNYVNQIVFLPFFQKAFNESLNKQDLPAMTINGTITSVVSDVPEFKEVLFNMSYTIFSSSNLSKAEMEFLETLIATLIDVDSSLVILETTSNSSVFEINIVSQSIENVNNVTQFVSSPVFQQLLQREVIENDLPSMTFNNSVSLVQSSSSLPINILLYNISFEMNATFWNVSEGELLIIRKLISRIIDVERADIVLNVNENSSAIEIVIASQPIDVVLLVTELLLSGEFSNNFNISAQRYNLPALIVNSTVELKEDGIISNANVRYNISFSIASATFNVSQGALEALITALSDLLSLNETDVVLHIADNTSIEVVIVSQTQEVIDYVTKFIASPLFSRELNQIVVEQDLPNVAVNSTISSVETDVTVIVSPPVETLILFNISFHLVTKTSNVSEETLNAVEDVLSNLLNIEKSSIHVEMIGNLSRIEVVISSQPNETINYISELITLPLFKKAFNDSITELDLPRIAINTSISVEQDTFPEVLFDLSFDLTTLPSDSKEIDLEILREVFSLLCDIDEELINVTIFGNTSDIQVVFLEQPITNVYNLTEFILSSTFQDLFKSMLQEEFLPLMSVNNTWTLVQSALDIPIQAIFYNISFPILLGETNSTEDIFVKLESIIATLLHINESMIELREKETSSEIDVIVFSQAINEILRITEIIASDGFAFDLSETLKLEGIPLKEVSSTTFVENQKRYVGNLANRLRSIQSRILSGQISPMDFNISFEILVHHGNMSLNELMNELENVLASLLTISESSIELKKNETSSEIEVIIISQEIDQVLNLTQILGSDEFADDFNHTLMLEGILLDELAISTKVENERRYIQNFQNRLRIIQSRILSGELLPIFLNVSFEIVNAMNVELDALPLDEMKVTISELLQIDEYFIEVHPNGFDLMVVIMSRTPEQVDFVSQIITSQLFKDSFNEKYSPFFSVKPVISLIETEEISSPTYLDEVTLYNISFSVTAESTDLIEEVYETLVENIAEILGVSSSSIFINATSETNTFEIIVLSQPIESMENITEIIASSSFQEALHESFSRVDITLSNIDGNVTVDSIQEYVLQDGFYNISFTVTTISPDFNETLFQHLQDTVTSLFYRLTLVSSSEIIVSRIIPCTKDEWDNCLEESRDSPLVKIMLVSQPVEIVQIVSTIIKSPFFRDALNGSLSILEIPLKEINTTLELVKNKMDLTPNTTPPPPPLTTPAPEPPEPEPTVVYNISFEVEIWLQNLTEANLNAIKESLSSFLNISEDDIELITDTNSSMLEIVLVAQPLEVIENVTQIVASSEFQEAFSKSLAALDISLITINTNVSVVEELINPPSTPTPTEKIIYNVSFSVIVVVLDDNVSVYEELKESLAELLNVSEFSIVIKSDTNSSNMDIVVTSLTYEMVQSISRIVSSTEFQIALNTTLTELEIPLMDINSNVTVTEEEIIVEPQPTEPPPPPPITPPPPYIPDYVCKKYSDCSYCLDNKLHALAKGCSGTGNAWFGYYNNFVPSGFLKYRCIYYEYGASNWILTSFKYCIDPPITNVTNNSSNITTTSQQISVIQTTSVPKTTPSKYIPKISFINISFSLKLSTSNLTAEELKEYQDILETLFNISQSRISSIHISLNSSVLQIIIKSQSNVVDQNLLSYINSSDFRNSLNNSLIRRNLPMGFLNANATVSQYFLFLDENFNCESFGDCQYCPNSSISRGCSGVSIFSDGIYFIQNFNPPNITPKYCTHKTEVWQYCYQEKNDMNYEYVYFIMTTTDTINTTKTIDMYENLTQSTLTAKSQYIEGGIPQMINNRRLLAVSFDIDYFVFTDSEEDKKAIARELSTGEFIAAINAKISEFNSSDFPTVSAIKVITKFENENAPTIPESYLLIIILISVIGGLVVVFGIVLAMLCLYKPSLFAWNSQKPQQSGSTIANTRIMTR